MDPLSLTASIIAIIGVGGQVAKAVKELASIKGAPDTILALHNEISDIRLVIIAIQDVFEKQRSTGIPFPGYRASEIHIDASVISALKQANKKVLGLEAMHHRLISFPSGHSGSTTIDKVTWLREQKKLKLLQEGLRGARLKLAAALGVMNSSSLLRLETGIHILQNRLRDLQDDQQRIRLTQDQRSVKEEAAIQGLESMISNLERDQKRLVTVLDKGSTQQETAVKGLQRRIIDLQSYQQEVETAQGQRLIRHELAMHEPMARLLALQQRLELKIDLTEATSIARVAQSTASASMQLRSSVGTSFTHSLCASASISQARCSNGCVCVCHRRRIRETPKFLTHFLGTLFIGYAGLPRVIQPCNVPGCTQRTGPTVTLTYFFPVWLLARALFMAMKISSCDGPQFCLRVPRIVSNSSAIFTVARKGDVEGIKQILQQRQGSPFDRDVFIGYSPIMYAIAYMRLDVCELLLHVGADPYQEDHSHRNAFDHVWDMILRKSGDPTTLSRMGSLFPNDDYLDKYRFTLLHKTVLGLNSLELTTLLQSVPISTINEGDAYGRTPVWWAATRGDLASLTSLLSRGADVNITNTRGGRALDATILSKHEACISLLLDYGHDVDYRDPRGWTPLHACCLNGASVDIVERLIKKGANVEGCTKQGGTPLHIASQHDEERLLRCLISHGAKCDSTNIHGESPITYAIQANASQTLGILLQHRADYSIKTKAGETLLHVAAQRADSKCLNVLHSFDLWRINVEDRITGVSPSQTSKGLIGLTALEIAERRTDVTPEWLDIFRKLVHEVKFPEDRASTDHVLEEVEEFEDAVENQDR